MDGGITNAEEDGMEACLDVEASEMRGVNHTKCFMVSHSVAFGMYTKVPHLLRAFYSAFKYIIQFL